MLGVRGQKLRSNRFWIILLCIVVMLSLVSIFALRHGAGYFARIYQDGVLIEAINLSETSDPQTITLQSDRGTNVIFAEYRRIRMLEADCPDGSCVRQNWVSSGMVPIVCLPHRIVIEIHGDSGESVDAVVG